MTTTKLTRGSERSGLRWMPISKVEAWPKNPRLNDQAVEPVARLILRFGFVSPIVVWRGHSMICAGHTRCKAIRFLQANRPVYDAELDDDGAETGRRVFVDWEDRPDDDPFWVPAGYEEDGSIVLAPGADMVPVRWQSFANASEAEAFAIADNKANELADWDADQLAKDLLALQQAGAAIDDLGFDQSELDEMLNSLIQVDPHTRVPGGSKPKLRSAPGGVKLHVGDCLHVLRKIPDESIDALVTDPPYGLSEEPDIVEVLTAWMAGDQYEHGSAGFMGKDWDSFVPGPRVWREVFRVLKPGSHGVVFASDRTHDLMGIALRLAGFEIRGTLAWTQWQGMPHSRDISKDIDELHGATRRVVGRSENWGAASASTANAPNGTWEITEPETDDAKKWDGHGTNVKGAIEPAWLIRKPIREKSIARQVLATGTGTININATRFQQGDPMWLGPQDETPGWATWDGIAPDGPSWGQGALNDGSKKTPWDDDRGRFPANLLYCPKVSRSEREAGCEGLPTKSGADAVGRDPDSIGINNPRAGAGRTAAELHNWHPTVKPLRLMAWLVRLVGGQPGSVVLDPFMGSGSTGASAVPQGFDFIGIDLESEHVDIARQRIAHWTETGLDDLLYKPKTDNEADKDAGAVP